MQINSALRAAASATFAIALATGATPAAAQTIGVKLGASLANFSIEGPDETDGRTGFVGGGSIGFGLGRFGIQAEILSVTKGAEFTGDDPLSIELEYVEIPLLIQVPPMIGSSFSPYIFGGPAIAFEISCESKGDATEGECTGDNAFNRKSTDIGLAAGAGLAFAFGPGSLILEARHTWGTTNIADDAPAGIEVKNRATYLMAGFTIPLTRRY